MRNIIIWGAGNNLQVVYDSINFNKGKIVGIVDSNINKQNTQWNNIKICAPNSIQEMKYDYIIISTFAYEDIINNCLKIGVIVDKIIIFWNNEKKFDFLWDCPKENYCLKRENENLKLKLDNIRYELGLENVPLIQEPCEALKKILRDDSSLCRFGDGEFEMIRMNERPWFQQSNINLSKRLKDVLDSNYENINIAIANLYGSLDKYTEEAAFGMRKYMDCETRNAHMQLLDKKRVYFDAYVTRPYLIYRDKKACDITFKLWKDIFQARNLLIVEGINSRFGVNNDFISGALSVRRILCPAKNAYDVYEKILDIVLKNAKPGDLVLVTLGPTATVLAYDIAKAGYQAIDIGQVDNEYDWCLRKADRRIPIEGKCVSEVYNGRIPSDDIDLKQYKKECIAIVEG